MRSRVMRRRMHRPDGWLDITKDRYSSSKKAFNGKELRN